MPQSREVGGHTSTQTEERRVEVDVVRFEATKLPTGLYRHQPAKFIFQLSSKDSREGWDRE